MPRFWQVEFYPMGPDVPDEAHPHWGPFPIKRLADCGTVVARAYSEALRNGPPVPAKTSWGRLLLTPGAPPFTPSEIEATASLGEGELHPVPPPPLALLDLPDAERRLALLDFLHQHLLRLAQVRGWNQQPFERAREVVISAGVQYTLQSPPKSSPDRRHKAQLTLEVDGDGDAWLQLTVANRAGEIVHTSPPLTTYLSTKSFNAARRSLHWLNNETVSVNAQPNIGFGSEAGGLYTANLQTGLT